MYIFKNAFISIKRNLGRNILLGLIILAIASATTVTLAIKNSSKALIDSYNEKYDITASISVNRHKVKGNIMRPTEGASNLENQAYHDLQMEAMKEAFSQESQLSEEDIKSYADSKYVKSYYYTSSINLNSDSIDTVSSTSSSSQEPGMMGGKMNGGPEQNNGDFKIVGYSSYDAMTDFISGKYKITNGQVSEDFEANNCVINEELAILNNISVGDALTFVDPNNEENTYQLTVTGIFEEISNDESNMMSMFTQSANTIITNTSTINNIVSSNEDLNSTTTPTFILTNEDAVEKFTNEVTNKGLSEYLTITSNLDSIKNATSSISNVQNFAQTSLIIILIIGGIVLLVLNFINIKQRTYEIGVLRTIGMKKSLLTAQFSIELLTVAIISLMLGAGIGSIASVPVSNSLLQNEISSSQSAMEEIRGNFGGGNFGGMKGDRGPVNGVAQIEAFESINATVDAKVLSQLVIIGIALTLVSCSACMISIQRFSPLSILKERG